MLPYEEDEFKPTEGNFDDTIYGDLSTAETVYEAMEDWMHGKGGDSWSQEEWFSMIHEVDNYETWVDEDGEFHGEFDFQWESDDGEYGGVGHVSW